MLEIGDSGDFVTYLHEFLDRHYRGSMTIPPAITGEFDEKTETVVRAFQSYYGLLGGGRLG